MATSITHRATGLALAVGALVVAWWLIAAASGPDAYNIFSAVARNPVGQIILFAFTWSIAFHLLNGIRHLAWDIGFGFEVRTANRTGIAVVALSLLLALAAWAFAYGQKGLHL
jgi:succinate dehydrogenase / fumarate reductase cytochrome b subunit